MRRFIVIAALAILTNACEQRKDKTKVNSVYDGSKRVLSGEELREWDESMERLALNNNYRNALLIDKAEIKTNSDYQSTYYFTVTNNSKDKIVAFVLGGNKFKVSLNPSKTYSGKMKAKYRYTSEYKVESIVLANGTYIEIPKESTTRKSSVMTNLN